MPLGGQQALVLVLAVEVDERLPDLAEHRDRRRRSVDEDPAGSRGADLAPHDEPRLPRHRAPCASRSASSGAVRAARRPPRPRRGRRRRARAPLSPRSPARQTEGVDDDRLAGAGLAGEDVQAPRRIRREGPRSSRGCGCAASSAWGSLGEAVTGRARIPRSALVGLGRWRVLAPCGACPPSRASTRPVSTSGRSSSAPAPWRSSCSFVLAGVLGRLVGDHRRAVARRSGAPQRETDAFLERFKKGGGLAAIQDATATLTAQPRSPTCSAPRSGRSRSTRPRREAPTPATVEALDRVLRKSASVQITELERSLGLSRDDGGRHAVHRAVRHGVGDHERLPRIGVTRHGLARRRTPPGSPRRSSPPPRGWPPRSPR